MLISTILNFQTVRFAPGNDLAYPLHPAHLHRDRMAP